MGFMIVLVSPDERGILGNAGDRMPLAITYLSGALGSNNIRHTAFDLNKTKRDDALNAIRVLQPTHLGVTYLTPTKKQMNDFIEDTRKVSPHTVVIAGGIDVTNDPNKSKADFEVIGPGESQLINILLGGNEEFNIDRYQNNRRIFSDKDYKYKLDGLKATTMITSRGCPNKCSFCSVPEKKTTFRSLERISEELEFIAQHYQAVHIYDDSFLVNKTRALKVMDELARYNLKYRIEARAEHITPEIASDLAGTGCIKVAMGIESGSNEILRLNHKSSTTEQA
jgi:radical SAM superfamily enzyme YgiQ (UPF0313 family)